MIARRIPVGLMLALLLGGIVVLATYRDHGPNWDEAMQSTYGELALRYFRSGFTDDRCNSFQDLRFYGPLVEMIPAAIQGAAPAGLNELRHLIVALFGLATLPAIFWLASMTHGRGVALLALLALATMPRFHGDWFGNSKDIPFACLFAWSMLALAALLRAPRPTKRQVIACGVAFGLTLAVRPGGFPLLVAVSGIATALSLVIPRTGRLRVEDRIDDLPGGADALQGLRERAVDLLASGATAFTLAWIIMVLPWPWAHEAPLAHPIEAMRAAASFAVAHPVLFDGSVVSSDALPRHYLPWSLLITTPPLLLVLALAGIVTGLTRARRDMSASFPFLLALLWLVIPVSLAMLVRPNIYNGIRHFLFVLPALALLAAQGAAWLIERAAAGGRGLRISAVVAASAAILLPVKDLVALHPYQSTYFNGLVGGVAGADGRYDTDYWLTSYREAMEWVNAQAAASPGESIHVIVAGDGYINPWIQEHAGPGVVARIVREPPGEPLLPEGVDYYIASKQRGFEQGARDAPVVHRVGRGGAVFTVIKGRP